VLPITIFEAMPKELLITKATFVNFSLSNKLISARATASAVPKKLTVELGGN
jgi:hypothetical protein